MGFTPAVGRLRVRVLSPNGEKGRGGVALALYQGHMGGRETKKFLLVKGYHLKERKGKGGPPCAAGEKRRGGTDLVFGPRQRAAQACFVIAWRRDQEPQKKKP